MADDYSGITLPSGSGVPHSLDHPATSFNVSDDNSSLSTGDLRRQYNFGNSFTKLSFRRDPFLHLMNRIKGLKDPTDDAKWKYTERRKTSVYKRAAYPVGIDTTGVLSADLLYENATTTWAQFIGNAGASNRYKVSASNAFQDLSLGSEFTMLFAGDYATAGNKVNKAGWTSSSTGFIALGSVGTRPNFFLPNQTIKINLTNSLYDENNEVSAAKTVKDYAICRVLSVYNWDQKNASSVAQREGVALNLKLIRVQTTAANEYPVYMADDALLDVSHSTGTSSMAERLELARTYVVGTGYHELSGYGETWRPQPYSTQTGFNQIFKVSAMMSGRAMATKLKFESNPWAEEWEEKMLEMNWDIGQTAYFGDQYEDDDGYTYTEGFINYALANANTFSLTRSSKNLDDFLEDFSALNDPRYQYDLGSSMAYFVDTPTWNWLHKLGGQSLHQNTAELSSNYAVQLAGKGKIVGVDYSSFNVLGSRLNAIRDVHLDGSPVKMAAINLKQAKIRPLIGNGQNRDVTVHVGVKTIANSGEDYRVDLIQGDIGFKFGAGETHAIWT